MIPFVISTFFHYSFVLLSWVNFFPSILIITISSRSLPISLSIYIFYTSVSLPLSLPAETEVMVSQLCLMCGSTLNCQTLCLGVRPRYSLVVDEDVKKPTNQPTLYLSFPLPPLSFSLFLSLSISIYIYLVRLFTTT